MSYDLRVAVKVEGCDQYADIATPEFDHPTYNLRDMFVACMDWDYSQGEYYPCSEYIKKIEHGIHELHNNEKAFELGKADRPTGHWIKNDNGTFSCSNCQSWIPEEQHHYARYCLYCGARMESEEE